MKTKKISLKKNDFVTVIAGKDKGKKGKILFLFPAIQRAIVEKINFVKRHTRPRHQGDQAGIIEKEAPIHISNLMIICGKCNKATRTRKKVLEDGKKVRICVKCGEIIE